MKKVLGILAVAALALVACTKDPTGGTDYTKPTLPAPPNADYHFTFIANSSDAQSGMKNPDGQTDKIKTITAPPGSTGVVVFEKAGAKDFEFSVVDPTRALKAGVEFWTKRISPIRQITVKSIFIPKSSGQEATLEVLVGDASVILTGLIVEEEPYTPYRQDVCRNWLVEETIIKVTGESIDKKLGAGVRFDGCNLSAISQTLVTDYNVKINTLGSEYDIRKIMIDPSGKFGIIFQGKEPYYGDYTLKGTSFSYNFTFYEDDDENNPILAGAATGKLTATNGYGRLEIKSDLKDNSGKKYSVDVILKMKSDKANEY